MADAPRTKVEREIERLLAKLEEETGRKILLVDVDMHRFTRLRTAIMFEDEVK